MEEVLWLYNVLLYLRMNQPILYASQTHGHHSHSHSSGHHSSSSHHESHSSSSHSSSSHSGSSHSGSWYSSGSRYRSGHDYNNIRSSSPDGGFGLFVLVTMVILAVVYIIAKLVEMVVQKREQ